MNGSELLLGVDIGTASTKGVLARPDGEILGIAERPHELLLPHPGWAEHDAETMWWKDFTGICAELLPKADGGSVAAVCLSGIGPCFLAADKDGRPLRPAILYGIDTRASREVEELTSRYGNADITRRCGNPLSAQSVGPKIAWLTRNEPEVYEQTRYFFMAHTFVAHRLTGAYVLDHSSASMVEPLYDTTQNRWIEEWCEEVAPGLEMPELRWSADVAGEITEAGAEATGLPAGIPVGVGTTDSFADSLSVGVRNPGDAIIIYGSTMSIITIAEESLPANNLWSNAHLFEGTYNLSSGMATSGSLTAWLRKISDGKSYADLTKEAAEVAPGSDGLVVLPYFAGERTPLLDPDARGVMCGLTLGHTRGHLYRALLESTAFGARHLLEVISKTGGESERVVAVGGGTKGGLWTQIISDITGMTQRLPEQTVGASYGDAMLAGIVCGLVDRDARWTPIADTVEPDPGNREIYDELYAIYRDLYPATRPMAHALANIQTRR
jgi:xylulokinase